jgi:hypothetical protein
VNIKVRQEGEKEGEEEEEYEVLIHQKKTFSYFMHSKIMAQTKKGKRVKFK